MEDRSNFDESVDLHCHRPDVFSEVRSTTQGDHVTINNSATLRVEARREMEDDIGLFCLPQQKSFCEIASSWPVLVFAQAGVKAVYYRVWNRHEYSKIHPVADFSRVKSQDLGDTPDPRDEQQEEASHVFLEMHETRGKRAEKIPDLPTSNLFTGIVVQADSPIIIDTGEQTLPLTANEDVSLHLGQKVCVEGEIIEYEAKSCVDVEGIEIISQ